MSYSGNRRTLDQWVAVLSSSDFMQSVDTLFVVGRTSPEGSNKVNYSVASARARNVRTYLLSQVPSLDPDRVVTLFKIGTWEDLGSLVRLDSLVPDRHEVLSILTLPIPERSKRMQLELLSNGSAYAYSERNLFPLMRTTAVEIKTRPAGDVLLTDSLHVKEVARINTDQTPKIEQPIVAPNMEDTLSSRSIGDSRVNKPLFALKTNLLYDAVSALNLELEVPIGRRWSVAVEGIFPWWMWAEKQYCLQVMSGNMEVKYWLGNRDKRPQLTGWYVGLFGGMGYYDIEWGDRGYQGEAFFMGGLSGGYAHTVNKSGTLRMEYGLGVGYMQTNYREYLPKMGLDDQWHLIRRQSGMFTWIGPVRAKVSLVWMLNKNVTKKGGSK